MKTFLLRCVHFLFALATASLSFPTHAWNRAGHRVSGAIAYQELKQADPAALNRAIEVLQAHPAYTIWQGVARDYPELALGQVLFMQAAVFPDDARRGQLKGMDRPDWHYLNYAYTPGKPLADVQVAEPFNGKLISALQENLVLYRNAANAAQDRANALCWVLHLIGDLHQPLHVAALVNDDFPQGDRGGNSAYVRGSERASNGVRLHTMWDDGVGGNTIDTRRASHIAAHLRASPPPATRAQPANGSEADAVRSWIAESYRLAVQFVYLNGALKYSVQDTANTGDAPIVPLGYTKQLKETAQAQVLLAGQRMARMLQK